MNAGAPTVTLTRVDLIGSEDSGAFRRKHPTLMASLILANRVAIEGRARVQSSVRSGGLLLTIAIVHCRRSITTNLRST
jgi:hypothetical protein